jgi:hypothetical protein
MTRPARSLPEGDRWATIDDAGATRTVASRPSATTPVWHAGMRVRRLLLFLVAVVVVACGPDAAHYEAVLDELHVPDAWQLARTTVEAPGADIDCTPLWGTGACQSVARYYLVAAKPVDAYPGAKQMLSAAGFVLDYDSGPACDLTPGGPACELSGVRASDAIRISINNSGEGASGLGIAEQDRIVVEVTAEGK